MFDTTFTSVFTTPLPPHTQKPNVLTLLHDPTVIISLSPIVREYHRIDTPSSSQTSPPEHAPTSSNNQSIYEITELVAILPFRLWEKSVTFTAEFVPLDDGTDAVVRVPGGLTIVSEWRVREGGAEGGGLVLEEKAEVKCGVFLLPIVKINHTKAHEEVHRKFLERLKEIEGGSLGD